MSEAIPYLDAMQLRNLVSPAEAVAAIEQALHEIDPSADPARYAVPLPHGQLLLMPSSSESAVGVKLTTVAPDNPSRGLPRVQAVYALFDADTLKPVVLLDGAALTTLRTPAVTVAAIRPALRLRDGAPRVAVYGAGPQARAHVETLAAVAELADVAYVVPDPRGRERVLAAHSPEAAAVVRAADVVICATTARQPLFDSGWLTDDVIVAAIGSHEPDARELDSALLARAQVIVEDVPTALRECGDIVLAIADDALSAESLVPLAEVVTGRVRPVDDQPVVFKGSGMAWQDLAVAKRVFAAYRSSESEPKS